MEDTLANQRTPWLRLLLLVGLVVAVGWAWNHVALWPIKLLVVLFHELGHAVAAWATGGTVIAIGLSPQEGGVTVTQGGSRLIILNAGYLGSLVAGVGLLAASRNGLVARAVVGALGVLLIGVDLFYVTLFSFGFWFTGVMGLVLLAVAALVPGFILKWVVRGLGVFSVLYALADVWSDVFARALDVSVRSDAVALAELTMIPAVVWGGAWVVAGLGLLVLLRKWLV
jgi:hypothetical protein